MQSSKVKEIDIPQNMSLMEYAQANKGVFVNLLNLCGKNPITGKYEGRYILSNKNLTGEKVKFEQAGQSIDATVIYSCLGTDYKNQKQYRKEFKEALDNLVKDYKTQERLDAHIAGENVDLKQLRKKGLLG